jgi:hypothetical protein
MARLRVAASPTKAPQKAVDAISPSTKPSKEPRVRFNVIPNRRPLYNPRVIGPIYKVNNGLASKMDPSTAPKLSTPVKGKAAVLSTISRAAKEDMEGYIAGDVEVVEKDGHEYIEPTGNKAVFFLQQNEPQESPSPINAATEAAFEELINDNDDGDWPWRGVLDFKEEVARSMIQSSPGSDEFEDASSDPFTIQESEEVIAQEPESPETPPGVRLMRTKTAPPLALAMARAKLIHDDTVSETESDEEDSLESSNHKIQRKLFAFAEPTTADEDEDLIQRTPPSAMAGHSPSRLPSRSPSVLPPSAIDIPFPRPASRRSTTSGSGSGLRRHSGSELLASMIARARKFSSSPEGSPSASPERSPPVPSSPVPSPSPSPSPKAPQPHTVFKFFRGPCYDPLFSGHAPCVTHDYDPPFASSADDALEVFLTRFDVEHFSTSTINYCRDWHDAKYETGSNMPQGGSRLREVMNAEEDEQVPEVVEKFAVYVVEIDDAVSTFKAWPTDIANTIELCSSPLPAISYAEMDNETILESSSSFEEDVSGMAVNTDEEPTASGFGSDDEASSVVALDYDSPSFEVVSVRTPLAQVASEDEVLRVSCVPSPFPTLTDSALQDYDSAFETGVAVWVDNERQDWIASGNQRRIQVRTVLPYYISTLLTDSNVRQRACRTRLLVFAIRELPRRT